jgi:chromosome segregation ATPase
MIKILLLTLSTFSLLYAPTATKKLSSPQVGQLQAEYPKANDKRKKEILSALTEGGFGHIANTLTIAAEQELNNQLKHTIFESEQTIAKLKQENSDVTAQLAQQKSNHESAITAQEKKAEALNKELQTLQKSLEASGDQKDKTITTSSKELADAKQESAEYQKKAKDLETEKKALQEKNKNLESTIKSYEQQLQEKQQQLEVSEKEQQSLSSKLRELQDLMGKAEAYCKNLYEENEQLKQKYETSTQEEPTLTKEQQIAEFDRKINALKVQLMADAVEQRKKDYATRMMKGISFETAEKVVQAGIKSEIDKLEAKKAAL